MYFDLNGDLDLTNDGVLPWAETNPFTDTFGGDSHVFQNVVLPVDYGPPLGKRPFVLVPLLQSASASAGVLQFVPAKWRSGEVTIAGVRFHASLNQARVLSGRFDRPFTQLTLYPLTEISPEQRTRPDSPLRLAGYLGELRQINGQLIALSASPLGDELRIEPYAGEMGVLEVGPGGRAITDLGMSGGLASTSRMVSLGQRELIPETQLARRHELPVGDYFATSLSVQYGRLRFGCRVLTDITPPSPDKPPAPLTYGIHIRKDKPFVLDFSGKPEVVIMGPAKKQVFKPGDSVDIRAMLAEPERGIMITGLYDTTRTKNVAKYKIGGKEIDVPTYERLDPDVVIRNSKGEEVAKGKMPFG